MKIKTKVSLFLVGISLTLGLAACLSESAQEAKLEAKAKISKADATRTALAKVPNSTMKSVEIEEEGGKLIWSFDLNTPDSRDITEVNVDAITGEVVGISKEAASSEAKEKD